MRRFILSLVILSFCYSAFLHAEDRLSRYLYRDTKQLVQLVEDAAALLEGKGLSAFTEFGQKGSRWYTEHYYLFVYDSGGTPIFHAEMPELVGNNLLDLRDMNGKPIIRFITDIGRQRERDAYGWVFYFWQNKNEFQPEWKSAYIRKVVLPDGKVCLVGSGGHHVKIEKVMVQDNVRSAAKLLQKDGKEVAFKEFLDPASRFSFLNTFVYVVDEQGRALVDPAFPDMQGRDLTAFRDTIGRQVMKEIIEKLSTSDETWVQYLWPRPGQVVSSRKLAYVSKVRIGEETLFVGSDFFLASPIWMR